jgi:hypothetical protein
MFKKISKIKQASTIPFKLPDIIPSKDDKGVILHISNLNEKTNKKYLRFIIEDKEFKEYSERIKTQSKENQTVSQLGFDAIVERRQDSKTQDRRILAQCVIQDWENVIDDEGKVVDYSPEVVQLFVDALDDSLVDLILDQLDDEKKFEVFIKIEEKRKK